MRKVLLVHISSSGCCNTLVTMLNNGDFGFPYCATPAFSTPSSLVPRFPVPRFQSPRIGGAIQVPQLQLQLQLARACQYKKCGNVRSHRLYIDRAASIDRNTETNIRRIMQLPSHSSIAVAVNYG